MNVMTQSAREYFHLCDLHEGEPEVRTSRAVVEVCTQCSKKMEQAGWVEHTTKEDKEPTNVEEV